MLITPTMSRSFIETVKLVPAPNPRAHRSLTDSPPVELKDAGAQSR